MGDTEQRKREKGYNRVSKRAEELLVGFISPYIHLHQYLLLAYAERK